MPTANTTLTSTIGQLPTRAARPQQRQPHSGQCSSTLRLICPLYFRVNFLQACQLLPEQDHQTQAYQPLAGQVHASSSHLFYPGTVNFNFMVKQLSFFSPSAPPFRLSLVGTSALLYRHFCAVMTLCPKSDHLLPPGFRLYVYDYSEDGDESDEDDEVEDIKDSFGRTR